MLTTSNRNRSRMQDSPLCAPDSQRAVLGSILLDNNLLRGPLCDLSVRDFSGVLDQEVYGAMLQLSEDSQTFGVVELAAVLKKSGHFRNGDSEIYLDGLTDGVVPQADRVAWHVKIIQDQAKLRRLCGLCETLQRESRELTANASQLVERFAQQVNVIHSRCDLERNSRRPEILNLFLVQGQEVPWLWKPYLATGMLAMLSGDPGAGKTFLALAIAAALTVGRLPYTSDPCFPTDVLYLSEENSPEHVVRPRFDLLGGDAHRFHLLRGSIVGEGKRARRGCVKLSDVELLSDSLKKTGAKLVVVDPIQSYLGAEVDVHRSNETRPVLDGLARLAEEHEACILLVRHFAKSPAGRAIHRGLGSIDLTGAVRTELHAGSVDEQRALVHAKSNVGQIGQSLGYCIAADGSFRWTGKSELTAVDLQEAESTREQRSDIDEACDYLEQTLAAGPRKVRELEEGTDVHPRTLRRAAQKLGVRRTRDGERGAWIWELEQA
jgi:RecA-family ATPase